MVKEKKDPSRGDGTARELRVILDRTALDRRYFNAALLNNRTLTVALERLHFTPSTPKGPSPKRQRRPNTRTTQPTSTPDLATSPRPPSAMETPPTLQNASAPSSPSPPHRPPVAPRQTATIPDRRDGDGNDAVPAPCNCPAPTLNPPRRRHAAVPRRVTYHRGVSTAVEDLEAMCGTPYSCGRLDELCQHCGAKFFTKEAKNRASVRLSCCKNGQVSIPVPHCPQEFRPLYTENSARSRQFLDHIRAANSLFAMASFKTPAPNQPVVRGQGHWSFSVCGQINHYTVGVPTSQELREPVLAHYYFLGVEEVTERRNDHLEGRVGPDTIEFLERSLRRHNRYIRAFCTVGGVLREETVRRGRRPVDDVVIAFSRTGDMNTRRREFNLPESRSEIAAVFYGMEPPFDVDLKLYPRRLPDGGDRHHELKNLHPMADPMVYPLLFPNAEDGYSMDLRHRNHKITLREFYRFRIQCRDIFSLLHNGGKLFQQYIVDAWVRVEADLLWWIRQNQQRFRFAANQAIRRAIAQNPEVANRVGRVIILPTCFQGGPRHMQRLYLDAMTVVASHGKPDLFITFTCNPRWEEITNNLEYNQKPENRPDLVCRVFHMKLVEFMDDIVHKQIFGIVQNYHYVIEFQKRGLPHAHIVVTFIPDDRIQTAEQVDEIISAVIPDSEAQPRLYELVGEYQVHRPCGSLNPNAACMDGGRCKKFFPKPHSNSTIVSGTRYHRPIYRRPRDHRFIRLPDCTVTNTRIVPYNPYALAKYQTHINFEIVGSLLALKYLFKYVTKGINYVTIYENDRDGGDVRLEIDEVRRYLDCRYVSSMEAAWRILEFKMHDRSHSVIVLPVHLPGDNLAIFDENDDVNNIGNRLERRSKLEAWFQLNATNEDARQYRYADVPDHFVWENARGEWQRRKQESKTIGCLAEVSSRQADLELFYLRLLLKHVRGATSFEDLRTVEGVTYETFKDACSAMNLLENTDEFNLCLSEAALMRHPRQMRRLFALIITVIPDHTIAKVPDMWRAHRRSLSEDFRRRGHGWRGSYLAIIRHIDDILARTKPELTCAILGIAVEDGAIEPSSSDEELDNVMMEDVGDETTTDDSLDSTIDGGGPIADYYRRVLSYYYVSETLNAEQKMIFLRVLKAISRTTGTPLPDNLPALLGDDTYRDIRNTNTADDHLFFVDGPGGSGKTFLYNVLIMYVTEILTLPVVSVAWTGIAANLLIRGKTVHKAFRLPLTLNAETSVGWHAESAESTAFRRIGLILWDEAPMTHRHAVEAVDRFLRETCDARGTPMGGRCCVFGGDFRQVLPVVPYGHRTTIIDASIKRLRFWGEFRQLRLKTNHRAGQGLPDEWPRRLPELGHRTFAEWLLALGEGRLPYVAFKNYRSLPDDLIEIPRTFYVPDLRSLLDFVYPYGFSTEDVGDRAVLCPTNAMVNDVNESIVKSLEGEFRMYVSVDKLKDDIDIPQDLVNTVNVPELPPHELRLKVGAVVILLHNLDGESGECNGSRMRVTALGDHVIECRMLTGPNRGKIVWLPKIAMTARDPAFRKDIVRCQFPVRLAFAITINNAQGQTLGRVGIYLKRSCFEHGQLYVAFSRVGSPDNVRVYVEEALKQGSFRRKDNKKFTRNVVYHTLLRHDRPTDNNQRRGHNIIPLEQIIDQVFEDVDGDDVFDEIPLTRLIGETERDQEEEEETAATEMVEFVEDPFVDEAGIDLPLEFAPRRTEGELAARVSTADRPGTTGERLRGRPTFRRVSSSTSASGKDSA